MKRIRIVMTLVLTFCALFIVTIALSSTPARAQPNAQATATPAPSAQDRTFVTLVEEASGIYQVMILTLKADNQVEMLTDPLGDTPARIDFGTWEPGDGTVRVTLTGNDTSTYTNPLTFEFDQEPDRLVATAFDSTVFGDRGLTFYLRDIIEAKIAGMERAYVTLDLAAGFPLDPFLVSVNGGGELDVSNLSDECHGYIDANPSVTVRWSGEAELVRAFTYSDADPVLVVQTPGGEFLCGDDASRLVLDSQVEITAPPQGIYHIWVGSSQPNQLLPTILVLTTRAERNLGNFQLSDLVTRPPLALSDVVLPNAQRATTITEAVSRFTGTTGGTLGATPLTREVSSEGDIAAFEFDLGDGSCGGLIADTPDYVFDVSSALDQFTVLFEGEQDATLLVVGPDGAVTCNDDSVQATNVNPRVMLENPTQGRYAVFVGRINQDDAVEGTLTVTTDAQAAPQVLPPSE